MKRIAPEIEQKVFSAYQMGRTSKDIAREFEINPSTVIRIVRRNGGKVRSYPPPVLIEAIREEAGTMYESGIPGYKIAQQLGVSQSMVYEAIRRNGVKVLSHRRYALNENFFNEIDSEPKAYWLGFLAADGCITRGKYISLALNPKDEDHLKKSQLALNSDYPISYCKSGAQLRYTTARVTIYSPTLAKALIRHGVLPQKSSILTPSKVRPDLQRHYWRGIIDGDGSIILRQSPGRAPEAIVTLVGTKSIVMAFKAFVNLFAKSKVNPIHVKGSIWRIAFSGRPLPKRILHEPYDDSSVFLDRKKAKAQEVLDMPVIRKTKIEMHPERGE